MVPWNSTSGEFAFIWQSKWVGIIAIKTGRTQIHFRNDVLVDVASWLHARRVGERVKDSSTANLTFNICHSDMRRGFCASGRTEVFVKALTGSPLSAVFFCLHAFSLLARFFRSFALTYLEPDGWHFRLLISITLGTWSNLVPRALFPGFGGKSQGKAPWGRGWTWS